MPDEKLDGGCLCGATRYAVRGSPIVVAFCHCPSCRRSVGSPGVPWAMFPQDKFELVRGKPNYYESSKGVRRSFCGQCGTSLTYTAGVMPGLIDLTVGSFDDPAKLPPQMHIWESTRLPWLKSGDGLPGHQEFPPRE